MKRPPVKKYQRLCAQYNRAMQRAIRLEIRLNLLVDTQLTNEERNRRHDFPATIAGMEDATHMQTFVLPLSAEIDRWRDEEGGDK